MMGNSNACSNAMLRQCTSFAAPVTEPSFQGTVYEGGSMFCRASKPFNTVLGFQSILEFIIKLHWPRSAQVWACSSNMTPAATSFPFEVAHVKPSPSTNLISQRPQCDQQAHQDLEYNCKEKSQLQIICNSHG